MMWDQPASGGVVGADTMREVILANADGVPAGLLGLSSPTLRVVRGGEPGDGVGPGRA